jgi:hypothetical protein
VSKTPDLPHTPMTSTERLLAKALVRCIFVVGCADKRFARDMAGISDSAQAVLTERQRAYLLKLSHRYRRQLPAEWRCLGCGEKHAASEPRARRSRRCAPRVTSTKAI